MMIGVLFVVGLSLYPRFKRIDHLKATSSAEVQLQVPFRPDEVAELLLKSLQGNKSAPAPFNDFSAYVPKDGIFPENLKKNPSDVFLYEPTGDVYWPSEYRYDGKKADFRCSFILNQSSTDAGSRIRIFEYQPEIRVGNYFDPLGHAGPGMYWDIRMVEPTVVDREKLKTVLLNILRR